MDQAVILQSAGDTGTNEAACVCGSPQLCQNGRPVFVEFGYVTNHNNVLHTACQRLSFPQSANCLHWTIHKQHMTEMIKTLLVRRHAAYSEVFLIQQFRRHPHTKIHLQSWSALDTEFDVRLSMNNMLVRDSEHSLRLYSGYSGETWRAELWFTDTILIFSFWGFWTF